MKNLIYYRSKFVLIIVLSLIVITPILNAQEVDIDNSRVKLKSGTGRLELLSHNGELLYQQLSTDTWSFGITSKVSGNNQRGFQVKNSSWARVFEVRGDGTIIAKGQALNSDSIYKEEIRPLESEFEKLKRINAKQYKLKNEEKREGKEKKVHFGFIAQELEKVYPDMVFTDEDGLKSIFYTELIPVLLEAVKAQQAQIERQNKQLLEIEKRLAKLEQKLKY